jgi:hypothetical protein
MIFFIIWFLHIEWAIFFCVFVITLVAACDLTPLTCLGEVTFVATEVAFWIIIHEEDPSMRLGGGLPLRYLHPRLFCFHGRGMRLPHLYDTLVFHLGSSKLLAHPKAVRAYLCNEIHRLGFSLASGLRNGASNDFIILCAYDFDTLFFAATSATFADGFSIRYDMIFTALLFLIMVFPF